MRMNTDTYKHAAGSRRQWVDGSTLREPVLFLSLLAQKPKLARAMLSVTFTQNNFESC